MKRSMFAIICLSLIVIVLMYAFIDLRSRYIDMKSLYKDNIEDMKQKKESEIDSLKNENTKLLNDVVFRDAKFKKMGTVIDSLEQVKQKRTIIYIDKIKEIEGMNADETEKYWHDEID